MFHALSVAQSFAVASRPLIASIREADRNLADQLTRAVTNTVLNIAEGNRKDGADRAHRFRIAAGECGEALAAIELAAGLGYVPLDDSAPARTLADRVLAMLWRLRHPR